MDLLNNLRERIDLLSQKYTKNQKLLLGFAALALIVVTSSLIIFFTRPEYVTLYRDIDLTTASSVTKSLDEMTIPYKMNPDGSISVPKQYINKAKLELAGAGLPDAKFDYNDLINRNSMFMSDDEKDQARNFALQNEIAKVIESIPGVQKAFVNLTLPKSQEFILQENKPESKASVFLSLKDGVVLDQTSIDGIAMLVSNSAQGLESKNVTVHGPNGKVLNQNSGASGDSLSSSTNIELQAKVKQDVEKSLNNFLEPIFGYGNVSVMASVKLNFDTDTQQSKAFTTPIEGETEGLVRSLQENTEKVENSQDGNIPAGTEGNTEQITDYATINPDAANSNYDKNERIINYELNEIVKNVEKAKGQIEDLTVAVVLNKDSLEGKELTQERKDEITALINAATGLETKAVEVYAQSFNQDIKNALSETGNSGGIPMWTWIAFTAIAIIPILGLGIYMLLRRRKKAQEEPEKDSSLSGASSPNAEISQIEFEIKESGRKKSIESLIETNPDIVTQLLKTWLDED